MQPVLATVLLLLAAAVSAQDACYSGASVAGAAVGALIGALLLAALVFLAWRLYWRSRRGKHLVLVTDTEAGDQYAFDNPCFKDGTPIARTGWDKEPSKLEQKTKWTHWSPIGALVTNRCEKKKTLDDSAIEKPQSRLVTLRSRDFTGLGFSICGNMRDGIFVKDVMNKGPASESGHINPGDRIGSVQISFRHMVFEDAVTILSYASPYEVQLEVESASPSRPSTLIRTKRSSGNSTNSLQMGHPFYRSQSLMQIGKTSLSRMDVGGVTKSPKSHKSEEFDDSGGSNYPTLKLSSSPAGTYSKKENNKYEKTSISASSSPSNTIIKPERAKKLIPKGANEVKDSVEDCESKTDTLSKFHKFGVRVLPDKNSGENVHVVTDNKKKEPELTQNEKNSVLEKVVGESGLMKYPNPFPHESNLVVDSTGRPVANSLFYDERAIDVGPTPMQLDPRTHGSKSPDTNKHSRKSPSRDENPSESGKENQVKILLTKGLQNLKEKLHHDKRKTSSSPEPQYVSDESASNKNVIKKANRSHTTSMSSDSDGVEAEKPEKRGVFEKNVKPAEGITEINTHELSEKNINSELEITTGVPEEVQRAGIAARSNRKSSCIVPTPDETKDDSGDNLSDSENTDKPKRPNKRKAPLPPPEDTESVLKIAEIPRNNSPDSVGEYFKQNSWPNKDLQQMGEDTVDVNEKLINAELRHSADTSLASDTIPVILPDLAKDKTFTGGEKDVTNIVVDDSNTQFSGSFVIGKLKPESTEMLKIETPATDVLSLTQVDSSSSGTSTMETKNVDYEEPINISNTDSDSDLERLETDESYDLKRIRKGGTTIELNSSHITIHHTPPESEQDSSRKAASLGDLSRLDTEQPMSILERAVSLDLADGGTPIGGKKRKAPLPPPGEDYLGAALQDNDDGSTYRKEPRLDSALDTFQRRRLKKSSDWGTLEEALKQTDTPGSSHKFNSQVEVAGSLPEPKLQAAVVDQVRKQTAMTNDEQQSPTSISGISELDVTILTEVNGNASNFPSKSTSEQVTIQENINKFPSSVTEKCGENLLNGFTDTQKMVVHVSQEPEEKSVTNSTGRYFQIPSLSSSQLYQTEIKESSNGDNQTDHELSHPRKDGDNSLTFHSINLTPKKDNQYSLMGLVSSTPIQEKELTEQFSAVQSPLVTSSDIGISSIHVVSSTTDDSTILPSDVDVSGLTSTTEQYITACTNADSTTNPDDSNEFSWEIDSKPPDLPTSPVPVLSHITSSSFSSSPMTYITEIQVLTTPDSNSERPVDSFLSEISNKVLGSPNTLNHNIHTPDISSGLIHTPSLSEDEKSHISRGEAGSMSLGDQTLKNNISVTTISTNNSPTLSDENKLINEVDLTDQIPEIQLKEHSSKTTDKKSSKLPRPPVPPRRVETSVSSTIMLDIPKKSLHEIRLTDGIPENIVVGNSDSQSSISGGKFISFSSLTPRLLAGENNSRNNSSFEQWVFLDGPQEQKSLQTIKHNGLEVSSDGNVRQSDDLSSALPQQATSKLPTVTHIILDSNQSGGSVLQQ